MLVCITAEYNWFYIHRRNAMQSFQKYMCVWQLNRPSERVELIVY